MNTNLTRRGATLKATPGRELSDAEQGARSAALAAKRAANAVADRRRTPTPAESAARRAAAAEKAAANAVAAAARTPTAEDLAAKRRMTERADVIGTLERYGPLTQDALMPLLRLENPSTAAITRALDDLATAGRVVESGDVWALP